MFRQLLEELLLQVEGAVAAALMGFDGIAVEALATDDADLDPAALGTEFASHAAALLRTMDGLEAGPLAEVSFRAARLWGTTRMVNRQYFLILFLRPGGNLGRGRYLLRLLAPKVRQEL
ncbi:MAG: hypothetical protein RBU45_17555 [Myxococcota bacterium]|jgi:predicted regulator of Ras-like GTPase activity (Roadblock/LC7/MglB family)|nr:hypothetical protein [Myxococcota bacterium]